MRICLMIEGQEGVTWDEWLRLAAMAESLGYEGLFRSDHALSIFTPEDRGALDAWATISALAAVTGRITLGTLVSPIAFRHPSHLARVVATADQISAGRIEVGVGAGWFDREHAAFGFAMAPDADRVGLLAEYVEVLHRLLAERSAFDFTGSTYRLEGALLAPSPVRRPHPPIIMGGLAGPRAAAIAARWADEYNMWGTTPAGVAAKGDRLAAACEAIGRDPASLGLSINGNVLVGTDRADLLARARRHAAYQAIEVDPSDHIAGLDDSTLVGTPEQVLERIGDYAAAGVGRIMMQVFPHDDYEEIGLIGSEIVPAAAAMGPAG